MLLVQLVLRMVVVPILVLNALLMLLVLVLVLALLMLLMRHAIWIVLNLEKRLCLPSSAERVRRLSDCHGYSRAVWVSLDRGILWH